MIFRFQNISFFVLLLFSSEFAVAEDNEILSNAGEVVFAQILFRHGERTPEEPFPSDPYKNDSFWPIGWGQLTNAGKLHHYHLGQWLRERYDHLIPDGKYNQKVIFIQSTDMDRTLMSALANLAGMFPPSKDQQWSDLSWQPIPVHTIPKSLDKVLSMDHPCPKYDEEYNAFLKSKEMQEFNAEHKDLYDYLTKYAGAPIDNPKETEYLYSNLLIEEINNYTLPHWTKSVFPDKLYAMAGFSFQTKAYNKKLQRLKSGPLLKEMIQHMEDKKTKKLDPDRNIWVYSAHDTTVANLLNTLGVFEPHPPPFAASVLMELRKNSKNEFSVLIFYKNTTAEPKLMTIPGCTAACPLEEFVSLLKDVIPVDWDSECHSHELFDLTSDQPYNSLAIFVMVTSTLLVFLLLASTSLYWHKQKPSHLYKRLKMETL